MNIDFYGVDVSQLLYIFAKYSWKRFFFFSANLISRDVLLESNNCIFYFLESDL